MLPESIGRLTALESLQLGYCGLTELPVGVGHLTSLRTLYLGNLDELTTLSSTFGALLDLQELTEYDCGAFEISSILQLTSLHKLHLTSLPWLTTLPSTFGALFDIQ